MLKKITINSITIILLFGVIVSFATTFTNTIDTATPLGTDAPSVIDNRIREAKAGWQERLNVEHVFDLTGTQVSAADTGQHTAINCTSVTSAGAVSGTTGTFSGLLTASAAVTVGTTLDVTGNIDPTTYETTNGGFLDEDAMGSDSATKVASQQSIKAYIDAVDSADDFTPTSYAGEESITFPNGLIFKQGHVADAGATTTITYAAAFPTAIISANITPMNSVTQNHTSMMVSKTITAITIKDAGTYNAGYDWQAWGY